MIISSHQMALHVMAWHYMTLDRYIMVFCHYDVYMQPCMFNYFIPCKKPPEKRENQEIYMSQNENTEINYLFERASGTNQTEAKFKTELLLAFN